MGEVMVRSEPGDGRVGGQGGVEDPPESILVSAWAFESAGRVGRVFLSRGGPAGKSVRASDTLAGFSRPLNLFVSSCELLVRKAGW
jgi:hypothetical protein